jgi:phthiodiolone/phenolphthiodiolone dimycocerosates ketoreductase
MLSTRFGLGLSVFDARATLRLGLLAERLGYDSAWIADHLIDLEACKIDPWVVMGGIGAQTSRLHLGTAVTDVQRVHPAKLAQMLATLDEITGGGRTALGLGSGEVMNLTPFGLEWAEPNSRIARLIEAIEVIRLLWQSNRDTPVEYQGKYFRIKEAWLDQPHFSKPMPKIYVGALHSTKLLHATGKYGDGWLDFLSIPSLFQKKVQKIKEGAEKAGRNIDEIDRTVWLGASFTNDSSELAGGLKVMKILLASERNSLAKMGVEVPISDEQKYLHFTPTRTAVNEAVRASDKVPDHVAKQFMIYGDNVKEACDLLDSFVKVGATHFQFSMLTPKTDEMVEKFANKVLSAYR